jgi:hypothetical protein
MKRISFLKRHDLAVELALAFSTPAQQEQQEQQTPQAREITLPSAKACRLQLMQQDLQLTSAQQALWARMAERAAFLMRQRAARASRRQLKKTGSQLSLPALLAQLDAEEQIQATENIEMRDLALQLYAALDMGQKERMRELLLQDHRSPAVASANAGSSANAGGTGFAWLWAQLLPRLASAA